ncbi:MAG: DUF1611 domain-containing protein [Acidobacteriota bacterium]
MSEAPRQTAVVLANGLFETVFAKTTHGLVRGPSRYRILGVIDPDHAGRDAGELLDGKRRDIPIFSRVGELLAESAEQPDVCVVGVATIGGVLPEPVYAGLVEAAENGMTLVNGLHRLLSDDPELSRLTAEHGGEIIDIRKPRPTSELAFWSGEVLSQPALRIPVIGTDCAIGKRTTTALLRQACRDAGIKAEMVYTGQTGWLQGFDHGFIFDATPNDFVSGELERAILECQRDADPDVILIEGQAALRNPSGPCGSEMLISGAASGVILQHAPGRKYFEDYDDLGLEIPPISEEIELIRLLGSEVWAVTLNDHEMAPGTLEPTRSALEAQLAIPVVHPLEGGMTQLVDIVRQQLAARSSS